MGKIRGYYRKAAWFLGFIRCLASHGNLFITYIVTIVHCDCGVYMIEDKTLTLGGLIAIYHVM